METLTNKELIEVEVRPEHLDAAVAADKEQPDCHCSVCLGAQAINSALHSKGYSYKASLSFSSGIIIGKDLSLSLPPEFTALIVRYDQAYGNQAKLAALRKTLPQTHEVVLYENSTL